jgi:hypothetical protein
MRRLDLRGLALGGLALGDLALGLSLPPRRLQSSNIVSLLAIDSLIPRSEMASLTSSGLEKASG